jgi:hypothetical protein
MRIAMLVRRFWRDCNARGNKAKAEPVDAFWVEATSEEAEAAVFPLLGAAEVAQSRALAEECRKLAESRDCPVRAFCFLIARDLSTIDPFPVHYPFHHLWNAYSPFESIPARVVVHLEELRGLELPEGPGDS